QRPLFITKNHLSLVHHNPHLLELVDSLRNVRDFISRDVGRVAREASKKHHDRLGEFATASLGYDDWHHVKIEIAREFDPIETTIARPNLILGASRLFHHVLLYSDGFTAELVLRHHATVQRVEGVQQTDGERRT